VHLVLTQVVLIGTVRVLRVLTDDVMVGKVPLAHVDIPLDVRVDLALLVVLVVALPTCKVSATPRYRTPAALLPC